MRRCVGRTSALLEPPRLAWASRVCRAEGRGGLVKRDGESMGGVCAQPVRRHGASLARRLAGPRDDGETRSALAAACGGGGSTDTLELPERQGEHDAPRA